jgi:hypothetical protein
MQFNALYMIICMIKIIFLLRMTSSVPLTKSPTLNKENYVKKSIELIDKKRKFLQLVIKIYGLKC